MFKLTALGTLLAAGQLFAASTGIGAQGWTTHRDSLGFSLEIPGDWKVSNAAGRITVAGPNGERVTIYPLRVEGQLDADRARSVMVSLSSQFWPAQRWNMPRGGWQFGANGVRAVGADESKLRETTALWWLNTGQSATGFFYAVAAPPARFGAAEPVFARILDSFRVTRSGGSDRPMSTSDPLAGMQFWRWTDPTENAFSAEVPADWRVSGGVRRLSPTRRSDEIVAHSPDGQVTVRSGDVNMQTQFIEPNQTMMNLGQSEGQMASGGFMIMRFMPAVVFAANYVQMTIGRGCSNLQWLRQNDRPDYIQSLASRGLLLERNQYTAGEVTYSCQAGGQTYIGYLFVETSINPNPGLANVWSVQRLYGFTAIANRASQADAVLQRMQGTFGINPRWWTAEVGGDARIAENFRRYREFSWQLQQQTQANRWAAWERRTEQTGNNLRNYTRVVDPQTRQAYTVESGSGYYWIDPIQNVIAGTNIPYKPGWDFREMIETYK
jgi:hypothetical protein